MPYRPSPFLLSVEQFVQPRLPSRAVLTMAAMVSAAGLAVTITAIIVVETRAKCAWRWGCHFTDASFYDLVEFATIQPNAPAFGAEVDLNPLSVGHAQSDVANRTARGSPSFRISFRVPARFFRINYHSCFPFVQARLFGLSDFAIKNGSFWVLMVHSFFYLSHNSYHIIAHLL